MGGLVSRNTDITQLAAQCGIAPKHAAPFYVYLDVAIDGQPAGRIVVKLRGDVCPLTCENFRLLCTGERDGTRGLAGTEFHVVDPSHVVRAGLHAATPQRIARDKQRTSKLPPPCSAFDGRLFGEEAPGEIDHEYGTFAMRGKGDKAGTFGSEFYIFLGDADTAAAAQLDEEANVQPFGVLVSGAGVLEAMERCMANVFHSSDLQQQHVLGGRPAVPMVITRCGETRMPPRSAEQSTSLRSRRKKRRNSTDNFLEMMQASKQHAEDVQKAGNAQGWTREKITAEICAKGKLRPHSNSFTREMERDATLVGPSTSAEGHHDGETVVVLKFADVGDDNPSSSGSDNSWGGGEQIKEKDDDGDDAETKEQRRKVASTAKHPRLQPPREPSPSERARREERNFRRQHVAAARRIS